MKKKKTTRPSSLGSPFPDPAPSPNPTSGKEVRPTTHPFPTNCGPLTARLPAAVRVRGRPREPRQDPGSPPPRPRPEAPAAGVGRGRPFLPRPSAPRLAPKGPPSPALSPGTSLRELPAGPRAFGSRGKPVKIRGAGGETGSGPSVPPPSSLLYTLQERDAGGRPENALTAPQDPPRGRPTPLWTEVSPLPTPLLLIPSTSGLHLSFGPFLSRR